MAGEGASSQLSGGTTASFSSQTIALLARFTTPATAARKVLINETMNALVAAGLLAKLDCLYFLAGADEQCSRQNWAQNAYNLTAVSPAFTADRGFYGDGNNDTGAGTAELTSGFNPATAGGLFALDNATIGFYINDSPLPTTGSSFNYAGGNGSSGSGATFIRPLTSSSIISRVNSGATATISLDVPLRTRLGMKAVSRSVSTELVGYGNGKQQGAAVANTSAAIVSAEIRILHAGSSGFTYGGDRVAAAFWGQALSAAEHGSIYDIVRGYLSAIGGA